MYHGKTVAVIVPAFNEETKISQVVDTMPDFVDHILIVDDASTDQTAAVVGNLAKHAPRLISVRHEKNQGVGGAVATGYKWARDEGIEIAVVMAGDGQMDPADLSKILDPIATGEADYTKGNRLVYKEAYRLVPKVRFFGNAVLSMMTKIASGYWHIADSQSGYTAISRKALAIVDWDTMYRRYGQPNDLLVIFNVHNIRVRDVPVRPVYGQGERSGIVIPFVMFSISWLLLRRFLWRLKERHIIQDFHPLIFFYGLGISLFFVSVFLLVRLIVLWIDFGFAPALTAIALMFSSSMSLQAMFFAMWLDMEANKHLR